MERRVDLAAARLETEALARSFGLTRKTRFINVLDVAGTSKTQKDKGESSADGGGYSIAFEVPLYDFGRARVREAEQRSSRRSMRWQRRRSMRARRHARRSALTKRPTPSPPNIRIRCCRCETRSRPRPSCNLTPCRSTPLRCSKQRAPGLKRK